ncbi:MAG: TrkH family potassium uptake protein [Planctomycetota bacterium]
MRKGLLQRCRDLVRQDLNLRMVARVLGTFLTGFSLLMFVPVLVHVLAGGSIVEGDRNLFVGFGAAALVGGLSGMTLFRIGRQSDADFFRREGLLAVALVWILTGLLGGLPFWFTGSVQGYWDGVFEAISGMTTTGSSIFGAGGNPAIEDLPTAVLFWRALLHWVGGIGIVVMFLVFLPALGITEKKLFQAEVAGVSKEGVKPRIRESANALVRIYLAITLFLLLGFWVLGMGLFDAVCHSFATIATGGFSTKNGSVGQFQSVWIELLAILGMFLAAANFGLYFRVETLFRKAAKGRWFPRLHDLPRFREIRRIFWSDPEWRLYFAICVGLSLIIAVDLWLGHGSVVPSAEFDRHHDYGHVGECLRDSTFQTVSLVSSTGFANSNLHSWPMLAQLLILVAMFGGGCSGSTGGGLKLVRVLVIVSYVRFVLRRFIRPRSVEPFQIRGTRIDQDAVDGIFALFVLWVLVLVFGTLTVSLLEPRVDGLTCFASVLTCLSNMGPGFSALTPDSVTPANALAMDIGSYGSFGAYPASVKALLSFTMILGRLEIYTALIVFLPSFWKD